MRQRLYQEKYLCRKVQDIPYCRHLTLLVSGSLMSGRNLRQIARQAGIVRACVVPYDTAAPAGTEQFGPRSHPEETTLFVGTPLFCHSQICPHRRRGRARRGINRTATSLAGRGAGRRPHDELPFRPANGPQSFTDGGCHHQNFKFVRKNTTDSSRY